MVSSIPRIAFIVPPFIIGILVAAFPFHWKVIALIGVVILAIVAAITPRRRSEYILVLIFLGVGYGRAQLPFSGLPLFLFFSENSVIHQVRDFISTLFIHLLGDTTGGLVNSLVFGSHGVELSRNLKEEFRTAGTTHLLVASGAQVSILCSVIERIGEWFSLSPRANFLLSISLVVFYGCVSGASPPILRAVLMGMILVYGKLFGKDRDAMLALLAAVGALIMLEPSWVFDVGFQLTCVATLSLLLFASPMDELLSKKMWPPLAMAFSTVLPPFFCTAPILIYHFNKISWIAILSNFLVLPFIQIFTIFLFFCTPLMGIIPWSSEILRPVIQIAMTLFLSIIQFCAHFPGAVIPMAQPPAAVILVSYGFLIYLALMLRNVVPLPDFKSIFICLFCVGLGTTFWSWTYPGAGLGPMGGINAHFLNVGQGDSIFFRIPPGINVLIDGGPGGPSKYVVSKWLRRHGIWKLDRVILTHPHWDHYGGLANVLREFSVGEVWLNGQSSSSLSFQRLLQQIERLGIPWRTVHAGEVFHLTNMATVEVLHPGTSLVENTHSDINNNSIVFRLLYGDARFLFTGDIEKEGEAVVVGRGSVLDCDVLKVAHHGSKSSSSSYFLARAHPQVGIISCGKRNTYHHPHQSTLDNMVGAGIRIFRTDIGGEIEVTSDGRWIEVESNL